MSQQQVSGSTVFLIEDDIEMRLMLRDYLENSGLRIRCFEDAESFLHEFAAAGEAGAIIVSDINLPGRSGFQILDEVRARFPDLPFFLISANSDHSGHSPQNRRPTAFLRKPFALKALRTYIVEALAHAS